MSTRTLYLGLQILLRPPHCVQTVLLLSCQGLRRLQLLPQVISLPLSLGSPAQGRLHLLRLFSNIRFSCPDGVAESLDQGLRLLARKLTGGGLQNSGTSHTHIIKDLFEERSNHSML